MKEIKLIIISLLGFMSSHAQFTGGRGDGSDIKTTIQVSLSGLIGGTRPLYTGGSGDGFDKNSFAGLLQGTSTNILYSGGNGDGFEKNQFSGFLNSIGAVVLFNGGDGDGSDKSSFNGALNGQLLSMLFSGGDGDGFSAAQKQSFLSSMAMLYGGGDGDGFALATYNGTLVVLPLELISFDAVKKEDYVLVKWVTGNEQDNNFFTIERSQNGLLFNNLANVPSQGNSTSTQIYTENDRSPLPGRSYYRLKWTDAQGKPLYSEVRSVLFPANSGKDFILYPNPNGGGIVYVQLENMQADETISITISDMQGRSIYQAQKPSITAGRLSINLPNSLAKGQYSVTVLRNGERSTKVLIVQ